MNNQENSGDQDRREKLEGRDIRLHAPDRPPRQHGKVYRWFDNFWYHHKWKVIVVSFFAVVLIVCTVQMCQKEKSGDVGVVMAGPYGFMTADSGIEGLRACLANQLPADFDGDGQRKVDIVSYSIYSEEEIKALENMKDEEGNPAGISIDRYTNSTEYKNFTAYVTTGESSIFFLSPFLFEGLSKKNEYLADVGEVCGSLPAGAVAVTAPDGSVKHLGVRLKDTALYQNNSAMRVLPEDTVICLLGPYFMGKSSNEEYYQRSVDYFKALCGVTP